MAKSPTFAPESPYAEMESASVPALLMMNDCGRELVPFGCAANARFAGVVLASAARPVPVRAIVSGPASLSKVSVALSARAGKEDWYTTDQLAPATPGVIDPLDGAVTTKSAASAALPLEVTVAPEMFSVSTATPLGFVTATDCAAETVPTI